MAFRLKRDNMKVVGDFFLHMWNHTRIAFWKPLFLWFLLCLSQQGINSSLADCQLAFHMQDPMNIAMSHLVSTSAQLFSVVCEILIVVVYWKWKYLVWWTVFCTFCCSKWKSCRLLVVIYTNLYVTIFVCCSKSIDRIKHVLPSSFTYL